VAVLGSDPSSQSAATAMTPMTVITNSVEISLNTQQPFFSRFAIAIPPFSSRRLGYPLRVAGEPRLTLEHALLAFTTLAQMVQDGQ
jgi:hypothetical protein